MVISLAAKVAAFCRELGDEGADSLRAMARRQGPDMQSVFVRVEESLKAGQIGPELEVDLDSLDAMVKKAEGQGLYPSATRGFQPLPGYQGSPVSGGTGAQWWTCPRNRCAGRGRVRAGQQPPECAAAGEPLVPGPLPQ